MIRSRSCLWLAILALAVVGCSKADDAGSGLAAGDGDGDGGGDVGGPQTGEACSTAFAPAWTGSPLVLTGDTSGMANDHHFSGCADATWSYQAADLVYRLSLPAGSYMATLKPGHDYTYFSLLLVRATGCGGFDAACADRDDADLAHLYPRVPFAVASGESVYLVVDSALDPIQNELGTYDGPFTLTLESFVLGGLGTTCSGSYSCADDMVCFSKQDQPPGYCTDLCSLVDCGTGAVPMTCRDISDHPHYSADSLACIATSEIGTLALGAECHYSFQCDPASCVIPFAGDFFGECRTRCTTTCGANETCVDVSDDLLDPLPAGTVKVCAADSATGVVLQGDACIYTYECEGANVCSGGYCLP
ncbi:MAG: hypothetical protein HY903_05000 [Deltaproteobacteria bacterium]|nr:hypothetical protein [Deltaproteobacteria bacterium]